MTAGVLSPEFSRKHDFMAIGVVSAAHTTSHFFQLVIPSLYPWLMEAFGLSFLEAGSIMTCFFVVSAFGQAASGFLVDRCGPRAGLYFGLGLLCLAGLLVGASASFSMLAAAAVLAGLGNSVFHPADYSLINYNITGCRLGHAFAWHQITGNIGWALSPVFTVSIAAVAGWRAAAAAAASVPFLVCCILFLSRGLFPFDQVREKEEKEKAEAAGQGAAAAGEGCLSAFGFLRYRAVWLCFFFFFLTNAAFAVLQGFGPAIFRNAYGLDLASASLALTSYLVCCGAGNFVGGFCTNSRRFTPDQIIGMAFIAAAAVSVVLASQVLHGLWAVPLMGVMGFGVGTASPSRDIMIRRATVGRLGLGALGRVYGFTYCGLDVGSCIAPVLFGWILDMGHFSAALYGVAALQCLAVFTAAGIGTDNRRSRSEAGAAG